MNMQKTGKVAATICIAVFITGLAACSKEQPNEKLQIPSEAVDKKFDPEKCVSDWIDAFRKEKGEDEAPVNEDMLTEWGTWCKEGKTPDK